MLTEKDQSQIQDYIIQVLPQALRQNPEIASTIEGILAEQFPRRDEFARLLDEVKLQREETTQQREETNRCLDQVDLHLELVREEITQVREDMNQQFKLQREEIREEMNQQFNQQQSDSLDINLDIEQRLAKIHLRYEGIDKEIAQFDAWLRIISCLGIEKGQTLEELFALGLSYALGDHDILPETIQLRQRFLDSDGLVFLRKGKYIEADIMAEDGKLTIFNVKSAADIEDIDIDVLARKVKLIELQNPDKQVQGIFLSPGANETVKQCCTEYGLECAD